MLIDLSPQELYIASTAVHEMMLGWGEGGGIAPHIAALDQKLDAALAESQGRDPNQRDQVVEITFEDITPPDES